MLFIYLEPCSLFPNPCLPAFPPLRIAPALRNTQTHALLHCGGRPHRGGDRPRAGRGRAPRRRLRRARPRRRQLPHRARRRDRRDGARLRAAHLPHRRRARSGTTCNRFADDAAVPAPGAGRRPGPGLLAAGQPAHHQPVLRHDVSTRRGARLHRSSRPTPRSTRPANFEEQALRFVGRELYEAFFRATRASSGAWSPTELPASILKRLPVRFNYDDNYFFHRYQGMPERRLHARWCSASSTTPDLDVHLATRFDEMLSASFDSRLLVRPARRYFGYDHGRLGYRTLDFEAFRRRQGDYQGCAVMNYCDATVPFTRITEHKHFAPWEGRTRAPSAYREFSRACGPDDIPYYPIRLAGEEAMLRRLRRACPCRDRRHLRRAARHLPLSRHGRHHRRSALRSGYDASAHRGRRGYSGFLHRTVTNLNG